MYIAIAQINPTVGDLQGNIRKMIDYIRKARDEKADLIVFPEMSVTGYPPRDLLLYPEFIRRTHNIIETELQPEAYGISVILGAPWQEEGKGPLLNSALFLQEGRVVSVHHKVLLPNYDVFDEKRYFMPGNQCFLVDLHGKKVALTICEDIWNDKDYFERNRYSRNPVEELCQQGGELIVNISASPYHLGKLEERVHMLSSLSRKYGAGVIYVNQVGGNDELIFDGSSMAFSPQGEIVNRARPFGEELLYIGDDFVSLSHQTGKVETTEEFEEDMGWVYAALKLGLGDYLAKNGFHKVALGLSGGIDSAVVAAIAVDTVGPENVLGLIMPSPYSSQHSKKDAEHLGKNLGMQTRLISIETPFEAYINLLNENGEPLMDLAEENLQARIRGNILMYISNREGWMVLSPGNKSELAVGYTTLYGDMCGGVAVLADLPKMMVYSLANYINRQACTDIIPQSILHKVPSAELRPNQTDQDSLPPYEILDEILYYYIEKNKLASEITAMGYNADMVHDVIRKVDRAEYKRQQAPPGLRITCRAFGTGHRKPISKKVSGLDIDTKK